MVDASKYAEERIPFIKVEDVNSVKGDMKDRAALVTGEAVYRDFKDRVDPNQVKQKLVVPVDFKGKQFLLVLNYASGRRMVEVLGPQTEAWVGAKLALIVKGGQYPHIFVDVLEKP